MAQLQATGVTGSLVTTGNVGIGTAAPVRDLMIGNLSSVSTATPKTLSLGGTFSNSAGSNVKLKVYDDTGADVGGISVSSGQMEVNTWSTGKIAFYRGTTQSMIIDTSGNLGINTTSPIGKLQIGGTSGNLLTVGTLTNDWGGNIAMGITNGNGVILSKINAANDTNRVLVFLRDDTNGASILGYTPTGGGADIGFQIRANASSYFNGGNVGIGTTAPGADGLTIRREGGDRRVLLRLDRPNTPGLQTALQFTVSDIMVGQIQHEYAAANLNHMSFTLRSVGGADIIPLWLQNSGNVGIGTTAPNSRLSVNGGDFEFNRGTGALGNNYVVINKGSSNDGGIILTRDNAADFQIVNQGGSGNLTFYAYGAASEVLTILRSNGNVGIGTITPTAKLHVSGSATDTIIRAQSPSGSVLEVNGLLSGSLFNVNNALGVPIMEVSSDDKVVMGTFSAKTLVVTGSKVGIGTISPSSKFEVYDSANTNTVTITSDGANEQFRIRRYSNTNEQLIFGFHSSDYGYIQAVEQNVAYRPLSLNPNGGTVGIGTVSPTMYGSVGMEVAGPSQTGIRVSCSSTGKVEIGADSSGGYIQTAVAGNNLNFYTGNASTLVMTLTSAGNVGIGTTGPTEKLHVAGRIMAAGSGYTLNPTAPIFGQYSSTRGYVQVPTNGQFEIWTGGTYEIATFYENRNSVFYGNVGIGTTAPAKLLSVRSLDNAVTPFAGFYALNESQGVEIWYGGIQMGGSNGDVALSLASKGAENIVFKTNSSEKMRITSAGNVGIGTVAPLVGLDVRGATIITNQAGSNYNENLRLPQGTNGYATITLGGAIAPSGSDANQWSLLKNPSNEFEIRRQDTVLALINPSGNLGIGTTNPQSPFKLDVNGAGRFNYYIRLHDGNNPWDIGALFNYTNSDLFFSMNGSEKMRMNSNGQLCIGYTGANATGANSLIAAGNVGIGTTAPSQKLHIYGTNPTNLIQDPSTGYAVLQLDNASNGSFYAGVDNSAGTGFGSAYGRYLYSEGTYPMILVTNSTERIRILSDGNVGIGTTAPTNKLHIDSTDDNAYALRVQGNTNNALGVWTGIGIAGEGSNTKTAIIFEDIGVSYSRGKLHFALNNATDQTNATPSNAVMTLIPSGNVGIGTTNPGRRLDVLEGNVQIVANFQNTSTSSARIKFTDANTGAENVNIGAIGTRMAMWTNNLERLSIPSGGNVGIGVTNPSAKLHVSGTLRVDNAGSAPSSNNGNAISRYYGTDESYYLSEPNVWLAINVAGTAYVIPLYS